MNKIIYVLAFLSLLLNNELYAQKNEGIIFVQHDNWDGVLKESAISGKPVFVDLYTTWCGPCKVMDKIVYPNKLVGAYMNKKFISIKLDADKGLGKEIKKRFDIEAYPSFLFIDSKDRLFLRHTGSLDTTDLLKVAGSALKEFKSPKPIAVWDAEYEHKKNLGADWFYDYIFKKKSLGLEVKNLIEEYLALLPPDSFSSAQVRKMITYNNVSINGKGMELLLSMYAEDPYSIYLTGPFSSLKRVLDETLATASQNKDTGLLNNVLSVSNKMYDDPSIRKRAADMLKLRYFGYCKDTFMIKKLSVKYADQFILNKNIDSLKKADSVRLRNAVLFTFSTIDTMQLQNQKKFRDFIRLFRSEGKQIANDILEICNMLCNSCGKKIEDLRLLNHAKKWLEIGCQLYPNKNLYKMFSEGVSICLEKSGEGE